jgi:nicotinamidase-related amidase
VIVEDATTSRSAEMHDFPIKNIMPLLGRVLQAQAIGF